MAAEGRHTFVKNLKQFEMMIRVLLSILFIASVTAVNAQGIVSGSIKNQATQEPIVYAKVKVEGQNIRAVSDFDGIYKLKLPAGVYNLIFTEGEYIEVKMPVTVLDNEEVILNATMVSKIQNVKQVTVRGEKKKAPTSVAADDVRRQNEAVSSDGMTKRPDVEIWRLKSSRCFG